MAGGPGSDPSSRSAPLVANWVSVAGIMLAVAAFFAAVSLIVIDVFRGFRNPYLGVLTYMIAPAFLVAGLILVAAGVVLERRRRRRLAPGAIPAYPRIDLNVPRQRHALVAVVAISVVLLLFTALGTYRAYGFTESVAFCGRTCHQVMKPEYTAYQLSPHARVPCVDCHIGPGATWFVKSKLSGAYEVYATLTDTYQRPIPAPIEQLRPAQETCEQCHWPRMFYGAVERIFRHHLADEKNSPWTITMLLKIGGGDPLFSPVGGIHWHMNIANTVEYVAADTARQVIPWVRITDRQGHATVYQSTDKPLPDQQIAAARARVMDCIDCHNRPTHIYNAPSWSADMMLATGRIDARLPFVKKQGVLALTGKYATTSDALTGIETRLRDFYGHGYPELAASEGPAIAAAVSALQQAYEHNFFPLMKVDWRVYANNVGHKDSPGCFRCHDGEHASADGRRITHDCGACHTLVEQGGSGQLETSLRGLEFRHPLDIGDAWKETRCSECHDGALLE